MCDGVWRCVEQMSDDDNDDVPKKRSKKITYISHDDLLERSEKRFVDTNVRYRLESLANKSTSNPVFGIPFGSSTPTGGDDAEVFAEYNSFYNSYTSWVLAIPRSVYARDPCIFGELNRNFSLPGIENIYQTIMHLFFLAMHLAFSTLKRSHDFSFFVEKVIFDGDVQEDEYRTHYAGWRWHLFMKKNLEEEVCTFINHLLEVNTTNKRYDLTAFGSVIVTEEMLKLTQDKLLGLLKGYLLSGITQSEVMNIYRRAHIFDISKFLSMENSDIVLKAFHNAFISSRGDGEHPQICKKQTRIANGFYSRSGYNYFPIPHLVWRIWQVEDFNVTRFLNSYFPDYTPANALASQREFSMLIQQDGFSTSDGCGVANVFELSNLDEDAMRRLFPNAEQRQSFFENPLRAKDLVKFDSMQRDIRRIGKNTWVINQEAAFALVVRFATQNFGSLTPLISSREDFFFEYRNARHRVWSMFKQYFDPHTEEIAESQRAISRYVNTVISAPEHNQRHLSTLIDPDTLPTNLSYGNAWHVFEMSFFEEILNCMYTHKETFMIFRASLIASVNNAMNIHVLLPGSAATGKSFAVKSIVNHCLVGETWTDVGTETEKAQTAFTAQMVQNRTLVYHEVPGAMLGIGREGKGPSDREQLMKTLISEGSATLWELVYDSSGNKKKNSRDNKFTPPTRDIALRKIVGRFAFVGCLNDAFDQVSDPIFTRLLIMYVQYMHRDDGKSFEEAVISYNPNEDLTRLRCHPFRLLQSLHFAVTYAIEAKLLPEVDTNVAVIYLMYMFRVLKSLGFETNKSRHATRFLQILRCETIVEAVRKVFFSPVFHQMFMSNGISWDYEHLELVAPFLVTTEDVLFRCIGVYIQQYVDPVELLVIRLFRTGFFTNRMLQCDARGTTSDFLVANRLQHWRPPHANEEDFDYLVLPVRVFPEHDELVRRLMLVDRSPIETVKSVFKKAVNSLFKRRIKSFGEHSCNALFGRACADRVVNPPQLAFFKAQHVFFERLPNGSDIKKEHQSYVIHKSLLSLSGNLIVNELIQSCFHYHIRTMLMYPTDLVDHAVDHIDNTPEIKSWFHRANNENDELLVWDVAFCFSLFLEDCYDREVQTRIRRAEIKLDACRREIAFRKAPRTRPDYTSRASSSHIRDAVDSRVLTRDTFARGSDPGTLRSTTSSGNTGGRPTESGENEDNDSDLELDEAAEDEDEDEEVSEHVRTRLGRLDINVMNIDEPMLPGNIEDEISKRITDMDFASTVSETLETMSLRDVQRFAKELDVFLMAMRKRRKMPTSILYQDLIACRRFCIRGFPDSPISSIKYDHRDPACVEIIDMNDQRTKRESQTWLPFFLPPKKSSLQVFSSAQLSVQLTENFFEFVKRNESCCRIADLSRQQLGDMLNVLARAVYICEEETLLGSALSYTTVDVIPDRMLATATVRRGSNNVCRLLVDYRLLHYIFRHRRYVITGEQIPGQPHLCNMLPVVPKPFFLRVAANIVLNEEEMQTYIEHRSTHDQRAHRIEREYNHNDTTEEFVQSQVNEFLQYDDVVVDDGETSARPRSQSMAFLPSIMSIQRHPSPQDTALLERMQRIRDCKLFVIVNWDLETRIIDNFLRNIEQTSLELFEGNHRRLLVSLYQTCMKVAYPIVFEQLLRNRRKNTEELPKKDLYNKFSDVVYIKTTNPQAYPFALYKNTSEGKAMHKISKQDVRGYVPGSTAKSEIFGPSTRVKPKALRRQFSEMNSFLDGDAPMEQDFPSPSSSGTARELESMRDLHFNEEGMDCDDELPMVPSVYSNTYASPQRVRMREFLKSHPPQSFNGTVRASYSLSKIACYRNEDEDLETLTDVFGIRANFCDPKNFVHCSNVLHSFF